MAGYDGEIICFCGGLLGEPLNRQGVIVVNGDGLRFAEGEFVIEEGEAGGVGAATG
jgi:hypothetical protein